MNLARRSIDTAEFCQQRADNWLRKNRRGIECKKLSHWKDGNIHFLRYEIIDLISVSISCEYLLFQVDSKGAGMRIYKQNEHIQ
jgi:hypothetical protein